MPKKRDQTPIPQGRKGRVILGGKAGRRPGGGNRNGSGTTPGKAGRTHPGMGYGQSKFKIGPIRPDHPYRPNPHNPNPKHPDDD